MNFKTILTAVATALVLAAGVDTAVAGQVHHRRPYVDFLDFPFGEHCMRIGSHLHCSEPRRPKHYVIRVSCGEAKYRLRQHGYKNIVTKDCLDSLYAFTASKRGARYLVKVNAYTGYLKSTPL